MFTYSFFKVLSNFYLFNWRDSDRELVCSQLLTGTDKHQISCILVSGHIYPVSDVDMEIPTLQVSLLCLCFQWFLCSLSTSAAHCWIEILEKAENCDCVCWEGIGQLYKEGESDKGKEMLQGEKKEKKSIKKYKLNFQDGKKFNSSVTECLLIPQWVNVLIHCLKKWLKKQGDKNCRRHALI